MKEGANVSKSNFDFICQYRTYTNELDTMQNHYHQYYEIIYVIEGELKVTFENGHESVLNQSNILLIPPNIAHRIRSHSKGSQSLIMVNASEKFVDMLLRSHRKEILECFEYGVIQMDVSTKQIVYRNLMRLREKGSAYDCFSENNKIPFLDIVYELTEFVKSDKNFNAKRKLPNISYIAEIKEYIENNIGSDLKLETLAKRFNISKVHLSRQFKKETGESISEYITFNRMLVARRLIEENVMSIEKIALTVGYSSLSHFDKVFKKHEHNRGMTPSEYYKAHIEICNTDKE